MKDARELETREADDNADLRYRRSALRGRHASLQQGSKTIIATILEQVAYRRMAACSNRSIRHDLARWLLHASRDHALVKGNVTWLFRLRVIWSWMSCRPPIRPTCRRPRRSSRPTGRPSPPPASRKTAMASARPWTRSTAPQRRPASAMPIRMPTPTKVPQVYRKFEAMVLQNFVKNMLPNSETLYGKGSAGEIWKGMMAEQLGNTHRQERRRRHSREDVSGTGLQDAQHRRHQFGDQ